MAQRRWGLHWASALGVGLLGGCLCHSTNNADRLVCPTPPPPAPLPGQDPAALAVVSTEDSSRLPGGKSNYAVVDRRPGESVVPTVPSPEERARVEMKPVPAPLPLPTTPEPVLAPPPPAVVTTPPVTAGPAGAPTTRTAESLTPPESPLVGALRRALEKHPQEAAQFLEHYDRPNREMLLSLLTLAAGLGEGDLDKVRAEDLAGTLEQLQTIRAALCRKVPLKLERLCFCRKIEGFGQFEPLPDTHTFQSGPDSRPGERVQVYAEIRNFSSVSRKGAFETLLRSTLEVRDLQGHVAVSMNLGTVADHSQSPRQDYFLNFQFHVPPRLPAGSYVLKVIVEDVTPAAESDAKEAADGRKTESSLDFRVTAPAAAVAQKAE